MRINVIDPKYLMDQHLRAEYLEIQGMMLNYYRRSVLQTDFDWSRVPKHYTLGTGHAMFFYDKMKFVTRRFKRVVAECNARGFTTNLLELDYSIVKPEHMNDYEVSRKDIEVNLERVRQRISLKPEWYKYKGVNQTEVLVEEFYEGYNLFLNERN